MMPERRQLNNPKKRQLDEEHGASDADANSTGAVWL